MEGFIRPKIHCDDREVQFAECDSVHERRNLPDAPCKGIAERDWRLAIFCDADSKLHALFTTAHQDPERFVGMWQGETRWSWRWWGLCSCDVLFCGETLIGFNCKERLSPATDANVPRLTEGSAFFEAPFIERTCGKENRIRIVF